MTRAYDESPEMPGAAKATPDGLLTQVDRLEERLEVLAKTVTMLEGLLQPIIRPEEPAPTNNNETALKRVVTQSTVVHRVMAAGEGAMLLTDRLHVLMSRVDL